MDLRDQFASQCAAALAGAFSDPTQIARRAYDIAEALLAERTRRSDPEQASASTEDAALAFDPIFDPDAIDPGLLEPPYDPTWDIDDPPFARNVVPENDHIKPGLVRTRPGGEENVEGAKRSAG